ncbi:MAG: hypothetical protein EAY81_05235 [Bacteroidetes bacterium]|nr:MAG: hypothetical protein EAY81_05235 [Bacteroidota bacterium]
MLLPHENRRLILLTFFSCLLIQTFYEVIGLYLTAGLYELVGFKDYHLSFMGVLGCLEPKSRIVVGFPIFLYQTAVLVSGFLISRNATKPISLLIGALFTYKFVSGFITYIFMCIMMGEIPYLPDMEVAKFEEIAVPVFGNYFNYTIFNHVLHYISLIFAFYVCYQLVVNYWPAYFRKIIFTYGLAGSILGMFIWYFAIGLYLFPYPKF